jgi:hypothetical protein
MPENGWSSSTIRKIAAETDSAQMTSDAKVVAFAGAIREKPANKTIIQSSRTAKTDRVLSCQDAKRAGIALAPNPWYPLLESTSSVVARLKLLDPLIERFALG